HAQPSSWFLQAEKGLVYVVVSALILWKAIRGFETEQQQLVATNEQRLLLLKESGLIGVVSISREGRFTDANWAFRDMVGRPLEALLQMRTEAILAPGFELERKQAQVEFDRHGRTGLFRCDLVHHNGPLVPVIAGRAHVGPNGESIAYFLDVSPVLR